MSYQINLGQWNMLFAVPTSVVDRHLKLASEAQLKVLLYILRHAGEDKEAEEIATAAGISPDEVENAVSFWIDRGLVRSSNDALVPAESQPVPQTIIKENNAEQKPKVQKRTTAPPPRRPDQPYTTKRINEEPALKALVDEAQTVLGKTLASVDSGTLVMLHDTYGLPCEVLAMLLNYAASVGRANMRAVERIGIEWSDKAIYTVEGAEQEIERLMNSREAWGRVSSLIGVRNAGNPTQAQLANASRWVDEWNFNDEMIIEAYERCVNTKGTFSLSYMNAILKKWFEKKIFSLDSLSAFESSAKSSKIKASAKGSVYSAEGASFNLSEYESKSLFDDE